MSRRMFVAIEAPPAWQQVATETQAYLREALPADTRRVLRMVDPALMHVTVRFLGDLAEEAIAPLNRALAEQAAPLDFDLALGAAGSFGAAARTSVLWMGVEGDLEALHALAARVEAAVRSVGLPGEDRTFSPHLTLARVRREAGAVDRRAIAEAVQSAPPVEPSATLLPVRELVLVHSHLGGPQPRYEAVARYPPTAIS